ncbi:uncharacterized protein A1O9_11054 [Exophiala aquamarina CBS 119918]|uniref:Zn(2)-C6 fungal-type domain-containing protein n=1 Tax=Exophiala aquamarina CBS 119918 TaxID=1182545 RepID=A0A072PC38_9EURO|nr:uncharacterized protein A1O9_11054 [Exophiala aquamarina CBS 119918]KEF53145.1 hypothetical protein A1O9_11054 [Exophiala aquamarina CBS 119918]
MQDIPMKMSPTACEHCRCQKIRCSRTIPICSRCSRRQFHCHYPEPPRRRLVASTKQNLDEVKNRSTCVESGTVDARDEYTVEITAERSLPSTIFSPPQTEHSVRHLVEAASFNGKPLGRSTPRHATHAVCSLLPDHEVGLAMIEIFLTRHFPASLIFQRELLIEDYRAGNVSDHVLLSILAVVSLLLKGHPHNSIGATASITLRDDQGRLWAEEASRLTLSTADRPSLDTIRASEVLGFYWWAVGETERSAFYLSVTRHSLRMMKKRVLSRSSTDPTELKSLRCFHRLRQACWIKASLHDEARCSESFPLFLTPQHGGIEAYLEELSAIDETLAPNVDPNDWFTWDEVMGRNCASLCVRAFVLWGAIRDLVRQQWYGATTGYMTTLFEHDRRLEDFYSSVPTELKARNSVISCQPERLRRNMFFVNSIYHLCMIFLHSSAVPGLSGKGAKIQMSSTLSQTCARTALLNANLFAKMAREFLCTAPDFSKVPTFIGYCAFIAGSVHAFMLSADPRPSSNPHWARSLVSLHLLQGLGHYFPVILVFWRDLRAQLEAISGKQLCITDNAMRTIIHRTDSKAVEEEDVSAINKSLAELAKHRQGVSRLRPYAVTPSTDDFEDQDQMRHGKTVQQEYRHLVEDHPALSHPETPFATIQHDFNAVEADTDQRLETPFINDAYGSPTLSLPYTALHLDDEQMEDLFSETLQSTAGLTAADLFGLPGLF